MSESSGGAAGSFLLFARLWAAAGVFHFLSFPDWRWSSLPGLLLVAAALAVLARPTWVVFAFFILVDFACVSRHIAFLPNHILFSWVVNMTLLATLALTLARRSGREDPASEWLRAFAPWVRAEVAILYFWTAFHKLNTSYFNPEVSCSAVMLQEVSARLPIVPAGAWAESAVISGTLLCEAAIPLLLAVPGTRLAGLLLGIGFHGVLALHAHVGIYSFSATMFAMFSLFLPERFAERLRLPAWLRQALGAVAAAGLLALAVWRIGPRLLSVMPGAAYHFGIAAALIYAVVCFGVICRLGLRHAGDLRAAAPGTRRGAAWPLAFFPLLVALIGLQPYLGLRTLMCFSMFSNLQTDNGRSNHLLMPGWLQVTGWQRDLVAVVESSDPGLATLARDGLSIPFLELRRIRTSVNGPFTVVFRRKGELRKFVSDDASTHALILPLGPLAMRYSRFRPVEADPDSVHCRW